MPRDNICKICKHYWEMGNCKAFPDGIPEIFITGEHDHTKPFKGDGGIRFEPIKDLHNSNKR
jgi:hypothetical protein